MDAASPSQRMGIPATTFVEDVETYLSQSALDANSALVFFQERQRFQTLRSADVVATLQAKKGTGESEERCKHIPIPYTLEQIMKIAINLNAKFSQAMLANFEVSEGIYSQARIVDSDSVCLWLVANVMLEYSCEEANALLHMNLEDARASLEVLVADLRFLRDQVTITQVTIACIYNWDIQQRRVQQTSAAKDS